MMGMVSAIGYIEANITDIINCLGSSAVMYDVTLDNGFMDVTRKNGTWMDLRGIDSKLLGCIEPYILQSNIGVGPLDTASEDYLDEASERLHGMPGSGLSLLTTDT